MDDENWNGTAKRNGNLDAFDVQEVLGEGGFGVVRRAARVSDGSICAVKTVKPKNLKQLNRELELWVAVSSPYHREPHALHRVAPRPLLSPSRRGD